MITKVCDQCGSDKIRKTTEGCYDLNLSTWAQKARSGGLVHVICSECHHEFDVVEEYYIAPFGKIEQNLIISKGFVEVMADDGTLIRLVVNNENI